MLAQYLDFLFAGIALIFSGLTIRDYLANGHLTPASKTWRRMAVIFLAISIYLFFSNRMEGWG